MLNAPTEWRKYFEKSKDEGSKPNMTKSECKNEHTNWVDDAVVLELQASSLMLDPINMYRDETSISQVMSSSSTNNDAKRNKSPSVVSLSNQDSKKNNYREQFKENLQQRRERLKEEIRNMSNEIQQTTSTTVTRASLDIRGARSSMLQVVPTNTPTGSAERAARFQWENRHSGKLLTKMDDGSASIF